MSAFGRWLTAATLNVAGSVATAAVLPIVVFRADHDPVAVSALAVVEAAPYLLLGLLAGHLADRGDRRRIIVAGLCAAAVVAGVQAVGLLHGTSLPLVFGCALAGAVIFVLTDAAELGLLPRVADRSGLPRAWGRYSALSDTCAVAVPPVATLVLGLAGAPPVLLADLASFLVAAVLIGRLRLRQPEDGRVAAGGTGPEPDDDWRAGVRFIRGHRTLRHLVPAGFLNSTGFGGVVALLVVYAVGELGVPSDGLLIGLLLAATAVGRIGAGLAFPRLYRPARVRLLTLGGMLGSAGFVLGLVLARGAAVAIALLVGYGFLLGLTITTSIVYRQECAPERILSRVMTVGRMIGWGGQPVGAAVAGVVARAAGVRAAYAVAAGCFVAGSLLAARMPRAAPSPAAPPVRVGSVPAPGSPARHGRSLREDRADDGR